MTAFFANRLDAGHRTRAETAFVSEALHIETRLNQALVQRLDSFMSIADHVASVREVRADDLDRFLDLRRPPGTFDTERFPGIIVGENTTDIEALIARERQLGREAFDIRGASPTSATSTTTRSVITHVESDALRPVLEGFDVTGTSDAGLAPAGDPGEAAVHVVPLSAFRLVSPTSELAATETHLLLLSVDWVGVDGRRGFIAEAEGLDYRLQTFADILVDGYAIDVSVGDTSLALVDRRSENSIEFEQEIAIGTGDGSAVMLTVIGSAELLDAGTRTAPIVWWLGSAVSLLTALLVVVRAHGARRLARADRELELVQTLANTDPLTGLLNRHGLAETIDEPGHEAGTLIFVDLDDFKAVNDADGHDAGDRLLQRVASMYRHVARRNDVLARIGGDEFVFFVETTDATQVDSMCRRIEASTARLDERISATAGTSQRRNGDKSLRTLLLEADHDMFDRKRNKKAARTAQNSSSRQRHG